jgi:hypothetical protein
MGQGERSLVVEVRLLSDPCLWCWEICDEDSGRVVASSWADAWVGFASRAEARAAGAKHLAELQATGSAVLRAAPSTSLARRIAPEQARRAG